MVIKSGVFAGIFALILAFIAEIPIYPPNDLIISLKIFSFNDTDFYYWGYILNNGMAFTSTLGFVPESLISVSIWLILILIGLNSIFASTKKALINNSLKLFKINILLTVLFLTVFGIIIFFLILTDISSGLNVIGVGYYFIILILILNILALRTLKKK
jgi:hypothetical protein